MELRRLDERQIIGTVGDQFVAGGFANFAALEQKCPGHALDVACRKAQKVTVEPRPEHSQDAFKVQILAELGTHKAERLIEASFGIAETRNIKQAIRSKEPSGLFFGAQMHEGKGRALGLNGAALFGKLGDSFAAERATKVPEEHQKNGPPRDQGSKGLTALRWIGAQEGSVDLVGAKHAMASRCGSFQIPRDIYGNERRSMKCSTAVSKPE